MDGHDNSRIVSIAGQIGGLVRQAQHGRAIGVDLDFAAANVARQPGCISRYTPPLSCYRSVSQRSLSTPTNFLSTHVAEPWGSGIGFDSFLEKMLTDPASGAIPPPAGADTLKFNDNNQQVERARIDGMVLIGVRAKLAVLFQWGQGVVGPPLAPDFNAGPMVETIKDFIRDYVTIGIFHTADDVVVTGIVTPAPGLHAGEPWVGFTPLRYFDRENDDFAPVPPLLWPVYNRDPNFQIGLRQADFSVPAAANPNLNNAAIPFVNAAVAETAPFNMTNTVWQVSILIEALYIPPPEACEPGQWPGELCPTHKIGGHPDYDPAIPVFKSAMMPGAKARASADKSADKCDRCGCNEMPTPTEGILAKSFNLMDPRYNMREAAKQMLAIEHHLFNAPCNDCEQKHCLSLELFGEEGVTLDEQGGVPGQICAQIAKFAKVTERRLQGGEDKATVGADVRAFRKKVMGALRQMAKTNQ